MTSLREELAPRILPVVLANLTTRYPYHDAHLATAGDPPRGPELAHPTFGNSFDWHSSVHSHWTAVRLIEHFATHPCENPEALARLQMTVAEHLDSQRLAVERDYLAKHPSYERPYGWAWAMMLGAAVQTARTPVRQCAPALTGTIEWIGASAIAWLTALPEPVRHGVHSNTAFSMVLMLAAARTLRLQSLEHTIGTRAKGWFGNDRDWPQHWERSGHDFLSPGLAEADLMRETLAADAFGVWWNEFLPALQPQARILSVVDVADDADGHIVHLHGLNLSRAGMLARLARALQEPGLLQQARRLYAGSVEFAIRGDYFATHWLATYAWDAAVSIDEMIQPSSTRVRR